MHAVSHSAAVSYSPRYLIVRVSPFHLQRKRAAKEVRVHARQTRAPSHAHPPREEPGRMPQIELIQWWNH
eukprot:1743539-Rhodomonas_salina.2